LKRPRSKSKDVWKTWKQNLDKIGWDDLQITGQFTKKFLLPPKLMKLIFDYPIFQKIMPPTRTLSLFDTFLSMIYYLKTGCQFSVIEDVFGGDEKTHSRNIQKAINSSIILFKNAVEMTTYENCNAIKRELSRGKYPNPEVIWKADCIDTPIHSTDMNYYTSKKQCSSNHAIRLIDPNPTYHFF